MAQKLLRHKDAWGEIMHADGFCISSQSSHNPLTSRLFSDHLVQEEGSRWPTQFMNVGLKISATRLSNAIYKFRVDFLPIFTYFGTDTTTNKLNALQNLPFTSLSSVLGDKLCKFESNFNRSNTTITTGLSFTGLMNFLSRINACSEFFATKQGHLWSKMSITKQFRSVQL